MGELDFFSGVFFVKQNLIFKGPLSVDDNSDNSVEMFVNKEFLLVFDLFFDSFFKKDVEEFLEDITIVQRFKTRG